MKAFAIDTKDWEFVGATKNSRFFAPERGVLVAVPQAGTTDDGATAVENRAFQDKHFATVGSPGVVLVLIDGFVSQDKDARRVYQDISGPHVAAAGMIATSVLGRAIGSLSLGIKKPKIPVRMFATLEEAFPWARSMLTPPK